MSRAASRRPSTRRASLSRPWPWILKPPKLRLSRRFARVRAVLSVCVGGCTAAVTRAFYKNAVGAVVVCDVTRQSTLEAVAQWKAEIDSKVVFKGGAPVPAVLLVNKVDLLTDAEESFRIGASFEKMATECGFNSWSAPAPPLTAHFSARARERLPTILHSPFTF